MSQKSNTAKLLEHISQYKEAYEIDVCGLKITVFPNVFCPITPFSFESALMVKKNDATKNDTVLDLGTGTGIHAVVSALKGAKVVATDISEYAIKNCAYNAKKYGLEARIKTLQGNLFEPLSRDEKFDLIIANLPFENRPARTVLEKAVYDEEFQTHKKFFREVKDYMKNKGRILIAFSDIGDVNLFEGLAQEAELEFSRISHEKKLNCNWYVYKMKKKR